MTSVGDGDSDIGIFSNHLVGVYIIPAKLSKHEIQEISDSIKRQDGQVVSSIEEGNVILTVLHSPQRILRHTPHGNGIGFDQTVVKIEWLHDSIAKRQMLEMSKYAIDVPIAEVVKETIKEKDSIENFFQQTRPPHYDEVHYDLDPSFKNAAYCCEQPTPLICPNEGLVRQLKVLEHDRELEQEKMNALSYGKGIGAIRAYPRVITSAKEAEKMKHIGKKMAVKIKEYIEQGEISEVRNILNSKRYQILDMFWSVHDAGPSTALKWYEKGYTTIEEVREKEWHSLTSSQKIGIDLRDDFAKKVSRQDTEAIVKEVMRVCDTIEPGCLYTICGGYRRGKTQIGDVDLILTHPTPRKEMFLLGRLIEALEFEGILTHRLTVNESFSAHKRVETLGQKLPEKHHSFDTLDKILGVVKYKGIHRRLDIILTPIELYASTVLGWTGSKQFERDFRRLCETQGLQFDSSYGIIDKDTRLSKCLGQTEREFFDYVGLEYLEPEMRNA